MEPTAVRKRYDLGSFNSLTVLCAVLVIFLLLPIWVEFGTLRVLVEFFIFLGLAQMWNLLAGYAGVFSVGQQAFVGLGGYALFYAANTIGIHPFASVGFAAVLTAIVSAVFAPILFRLHGAFFAIGMWVFSEMFRIFVSNVDYFGGPSGQTLISIRNVERSLRIEGTYWLAVVLGFASIFSVYVILRSRYGLALRALRDQEVAASASGIEVQRLRKNIFIFAAGITGALGSIAYLSTYRIVPHAAFDINWVAIPVFIVIIGGVGTIEGPIIGTIIFFLIREYLADFGVIYMIVLGFVMVGTVMIFPQGIWGMIKQRYGINLLITDWHMKDSL